MTDVAEQPIAEAGPSEPTTGNGTGGPSIPALPPLERPVARLPEYPSFTAETTPEGISFDLLKQLCDDYKANCQVMLDCIQHLKFSDMELHMKHFWQEMSPAHRELIANQDVADWIWKLDAVLYDTILTLLIPNVLQVLPTHISQSIRQYSRHMEGWMLQSLEGFQPYLRNKKLEVSKIYLQQLRRVIMLNQLSQGAALVLDAGDQVHQMLLDWNRIDFEGLREQAAWVTDCRRLDVSQIMEIDIRQLLQPGVKLDHWTIWMDEVVTRSLDQKTPDHAKYIYSARQFLMRWNFYSTLTMRDLTLRSASSFGSFHLLYLFLNEYAFYVVEQRVASLKSLEILHKLQ